MILVDTGFLLALAARKDRRHAAATAALAKVRQDEFNCLGPFSDAKAGMCQELEFMSVDAKGLDAAFKTPSLRNAALRPPYMHAGQFANLADVLRHYVKAPAATVGHSELAHAGGRHAERPRVPLVPRAGQVRHGQVAGQQRPLQLEADEHVQVVRHLVGLRAD